MFNVKATTFLFHLLLQPISIYCNGVVTHQFQGLDEGRSRQLHEGLHDTCGFHVSLTTQVIHWQHTLARTILKDSPGPSYRPWLVIHQHLHATYWWCSSIGEREEFMTTSSNWASCEWVSGDAIGPPEVLLGKKVLCALVMLLELTGQRQCNNAQLLCFFFEKWALAEKDGSASSSTCWFENNMRPQLKAGGSLANLGFLGWLRG